MYTVGIDLGTSAMKLLLVDEDGAILRSVSRSYPLSLPRPGWSEQAPEERWTACLSGLEELLTGVDRRRVAAIGTGGQMHGLVALDREDRVIRPAILWNDGRTEAETAWLNESIGRARLTELTANIAFAGFTAPKLLWMRKNEPEAFARIAKIMLPKDYLTYRLTGVHATDYSDAGGTLLLDVAGKRWSPEMLAICGLREEQLPRLYESSAPVGRLLPELAERLGLSPETLVVAGAGDNAAAAVGTGTVGEGRCNLSLGTSGTLFISSEQFRVDGQNALHAFPHADGGFHLMGCMLSAASCLKWLCEDILRSADFAAEQEAVDPARLGRNGVFFLPYLMGERSPINDVNARGCFIGLGLESGRADLVQAVLEGVAFALRDSFEAARGLGLTVGAATLCGGGARSPLWRRILANVLGLELALPNTEEGPAYGAALLALVGCGAYPDVKTCAGALCRAVPCAAPEPELAARYEERYQKFKLLYPTLKELFPTLQAPQ